MTSPQSRPEGPIDFQGISEDIAMTYTNHMLDGIMNFDGLLASAIEAALRSVARKVEEEAIQRCGIMIAALVKEINALQLKI